MGLMNKKLIKILLGILQTILTVSVVVLLVVKAHSLRSQVLFTSSPGNIVLVSISALLFVLFYLVMSYHWLIAVRIFKPDTNRRLLLSFYASQPYKYLPTSLFTFSFRSKFAKDQGLAVGDSAKAQLIENGNMIASGLLSAGLALVWIYNWLLGLITICLVAGVLYGVYKSSRELSITLGRNHFKLQPKKVVPLVVLAVIGWSVAGVALWVLSLATTGSVGVLQSIGANSLAFSASILAVFAPGGVGVREVIYAHFGIALTVIVMWRLLTLGLDILLGFSAVAKISYFKRRG